MLRRRATDLNRLLQYLHGSDLGFCGRISPPPGPRRLAGAAEVRSSGWSGSMAREDWIRGCVSRCGGSEAEENGWRGESWRRRWAKRHEDDYGRGCGRGPGRKGRMWPDEGPGTDWRRWLARTSRPSRPHDPGRARWWVEEADRPVVATGRTEKPGRWPWDEKKRRMRGGSEVTGHDCRWPEGPATQ